MISYIVFKTGFCLYNAIYKDKHRIKQPKKGCTCNINIHSLQNMYKLCITLKIWIKRKCPWKYKYIIVRVRIIRSNEMLHIMFVWSEWDDLCLATRHDPALWIKLLLWSCSIHIYILYPSIKTQKKLNSLFELIKHLLTYWTNHF